MTTEKPSGRVLIIAGSDSGGGAGIQADIKTVTRFGAYAATAVTAITVQNTLGVSDVHPIPAPVVAAQIRAVLDDIGADVVKTGMLATAELVHAVADALEASGFKGLLVIDPVMVATSGDRLLADNAVEALKTRLIARADVVTPNLDEAAVLTGRPIHSPFDMARAGQEILALGARAAIMKGGHLEDETVTDLLVTADDIKSIEGAKVDTRHTHGTGCTLASGVAAALALGDDLPTAFARARGFVANAIAAAPGFGKGHGPLGHATAEVPEGGDA